MKKVDIYTDGACSGNPGEGGYAAILLHGDIERVISGGQKETTNNQMELMGVLEGLRALKFPCEVRVFSDSAYVVNAFTQGWIYGWQKNGWRREGGKSELKNESLWKELYQLTQTHNVTFVKVKGHSDNELNNRCDEIARNEIKKLSDTSGD